MCGGGGPLKFLLPAAAAIATPFIGPELVPAAISDVVGSTAATVGADVLTGAGLGALASAVTGGNPALGALTGGAGGGIAGGVASAFPGTLPTAGTMAGGGGAGGTVGATGTAAPASVAAPGAAAVGPAGSSITIPTGADTLSADTLMLTPPGSVAGATPAGAATGAGSLVPSGSVTGAATGMNLSPSDLAEFSSANPAGTAAIQDVLTGGAGAGGGAAGPGFWSSVGNLWNNPSIANLGKLATSVPPGALVTGGALGLEALLQPSTPSISGITSQLQSEASGLQGQSAALESYLQTGTLPTGVQAKLNQAADSAKASIRSEYARMGMTGSSAELEALSNVDQTVSAQGGQLALQMLQQGVTEGNLAASLYQQILNTAVSQNAQLAQAIGNFAGAAAGVGTGLTLRVGT